MSFIVDVMEDYISNHTENKKEENIDEYSGDLYWFPVEDIPRKINARIRLCYVDTYNNETLRNIDVSIFYRGKEGCKFDGYCHLRKARRTLSSKCVKEAIDLDTGEVISDLPAFFEHKYSETPEFVHGKLFEDHGWKIHVLIYIAAADGAMRVCDRNIIVRFCMNLKSHKLIDSSRIEEILKKLCRPNKFEFHKYIRESNPEPEVARVVYETAKEIVNANSKAHSEQIRCLKYIQEKWKDKLITDCLDQNNNLKQNY
ncbi:MAG: hypothetical protein QY317_16335 [Candidatus Jettenia caeni]|nr:MAG: hypothetical protein QY317_16335 [Candidatus Jettenia caeni]